MTYHEAQVWMERPKVLTVAAANAGRRYMRGWREAGVQGFIGYGACTYPMIFPNHHTGVGFATTSRMVKN